MAKRLFAASILLASRTGELRHFCCTGARDSGEAFLAEQIAAITAQHPDHQVIGRVVAEFKDGAIARAGYAPVAGPTGNPP